MVRRLLVLSLIAACASVFASAEERRQLGAHVHGHGHVNIAIEGKTLAIDAAAERLTSLSFDDFKEFPNTQGLEISLISPKGQSSFELTRDKPALSLMGYL